MTKEETIQMLESIERRCRDFPSMTAQDWVTIAAAKRHLNEDIYNERTKEAINSAANESLDGLLLAFNLACGNGDKTIGECLEELKPKIIDAVKKYLSSESIPVFKIGDYITDGNTQVEIKDIKENAYIVSNSQIENDANLGNWLIDFVDQNRWSIVVDESHVSEKERLRALSDGVQHLGWLDDANSLEEGEQAADFYSNLFSDIAPSYIRKDAFIAGANWQRNKDENELLSKCVDIMTAYAEGKKDMKEQYTSGDLEKASEIYERKRYFDSVVSHKTDFINGAKWMYDWVMKDAVDGNVILDLNGDIKIDMGNKDPFRVGDKVKLLAIKED